MKKRNIIIIIIIILLLLLSVVYISNLKNDKNKISNNTYNNTTNIKLNKTTDKNNSKNTTIKEDLKYYPSKGSAENKNNKKVDDVSDEALMAKKIVEKNVLDKNEIAGYPVYKDMGCWLVPIFDKNTGKFTGSVFAHPKGEGYVLGPDTHSEYKKLIHGKTSKKSDSNKHVKKDKSNSNKKNKSASNKKDKSSSNVSNNKQKETDVIGQKIDIIGKSNPDISINLDHINDNSGDRCFDEYNIFYLADETSISDSDN